MPQEDDPALRKPPASPVPARLLAALLASATLAGCSTPSFMSFPPQVRGNKVDDDILAQLVPGTSSRADVTALLGSPTTRATFDDSTWLYIGEVTRPVIAATNAVLDQKVVILTFNEQGVLRTIETKSKDDGVSVAVVTRSTPAPGNQSSFMQQLLGNVGKFSPAGAGGGAGGGAPGGSKF